jgi:lysophospholipase L1-like esterase
MPMGDSITYGFGDPNTNGYRAPLLNLVQAGGQSIDFVGSQQSGNFGDTDNEGYPGITISLLQATLTQNGSLTTYQPQIILLLIGTNDILIGSTSSKMLDDLSSLIDFIHSSAPQAKLIVGSIPPHGNDDIDTYNTAIPGLVLSKNGAGSWASFANTRAGLTDSDMSSDGIHPNPTGYAKIAAAWDQALSPLLGGTTSACDVNKDGATNVVDVQQAVNQALQIAACAADINRDGQCTIVDVQRIVNAVLGGPCVSP